MAELALLWHMHQPDYRSPTTGRPVMPWTRLHALRGYRDLVVESLEHQVAATINFVPSLLDQLLWYAGGGDDPQLALTRRPADALLAPEAAQIRDTFICGHPAMVEAHPPYVALRERIVRAERVSVADLRDLQVWSTLAWFGATALRDYPILQELRAKGVGFTEEDKFAMLNAQAALLADLPARIAALAGTRTALCTTPYYHPILPLLVDVAHARRCMPDVPLDVESAWPEDALLQLTSARARFAEVLGAEVFGLWPSEGSVSPEVVALAARAGFRWLASDEHVLWHSDRTEGPNNGNWDLGGVRGFFRDRDLSDRIGFQYAQRPGDQAAAELLAEVARRGGERGVITVVLDGENPWESYADAGASFRAALFTALREGPVRGVTLDEVAQRPPVGTVTRLHTGSWIGADFRIWFGHADDRTAWRWIAAARRAIAAEPDPIKAEAALKRLLPAEGSDWMWWYGDDFSSPFDGVFDSLFRAHVRAAWAALGQPPPPELDAPLSLPSQSRTTSPKRLVGDGDRWLDWAGAGSIAWPPGAAMAVGVRLSTGLRFGWTEAGQLRLRVELTPSAAELPANAEWELDDGHVIVRQVHGARVSFALPAAEHHQLALRLMHEGRELARYPYDGTVHIACPAHPERLFGWA